ncbi:MAG: DNA ligase D [Alphaproteobacteria bacterium]|nr:DNA ligase D [Alphaproteobacteria bacterium]
MASSAARRKTVRHGDKLDVYRRKRDFARTPEPPPEVKSSAGGNSYVIQKHAARRLHYDFRLELDGVHLSWAVPNGPSLDPAERRLAIRTEDHPLEYGGFEGVIPAGEYGGGTVMLWDRGTWTWTKDPREWLPRGLLEFELHGERLRGGWVLTRLKPRPDEKGDKENWLLIKRRDAYARPGEGTSVIQSAVNSVATGRSMDEIASERSRVWSSKQGEIAPEAAGDAKPRPAARRKAAARPTFTESVATAPARKMPDFLPVQLATLVAVPPAGPKWLHEIKFDGYRMQALIDDRKVRMLTRTGLDWTSKFGPIAKALRELSVRSAIIDGEVVVQDQSGVSDFSALQQALSESKLDGLRYFAFDLLYLNGRDLTRLPLRERKAALAALLAANSGSALLLYSEHYLDRGREFFDQACRLALEGIVSKKAEAPYTAGRNPAWLKIKCTKRQEFVIGGWLSSTATGRDLRSLLVGYHEKGKLRYAGKVGTGFDEKSGGKLLAALKSRSRKDSPFVGVPAEIARGIHWIEPELVAEVEFGSWTRDRILRHASFAGLREDRDAREVVLETPIETTATADERTGKAAYAGVTLTHPDRVLWPEGGITKQALADYYASVAHLIMPHLAGRPLSLFRCPDGIGKHCFFQRHMGQGLPDAVKPVKVRNEKEPYLAIEDEAGLFSLIQFSTLEIHPWGARASDPEHPDRIVMDFDPSEELPWSTIVNAALECRERLSALGLKSFVKTTGGKGLHVVLPIAPRYEWKEVKAFAMALASSMAADSPRYVTNMAKSARKGRIFIDYLRNDRTSTAIAPYSTRARPGAPIALPVAWDELKLLPSGRHYTVATIGRRLAGLKSDPWAEMDGLKQQITAKARKAVGLKT